MFKLHAVVLRSNIFFKCTLSSAPSHFSASLVWITPLTSGSQEQPLLMVEPRNPDPMVPARADASWPGASYWNATFLRFGTMQHRIELRQIRAHKWFLLNTSRRRRREDTRLKSQCMLNAALANCQYLFSLKACVTTGKGLILDAGYNLYVLLSKIKRCSDTTK